MRQLVGLPWSPATALSAAARRLGLLTNIKGRLGLAWHQGSVGAAGLSSERPGKSASLGFARVSRWLRCRGYPTCACVRRKVLGTNRSAAHAGKRTCTIRQSAVAVSWTVPVFSPMHRQSKPDRAAEPTRGRIVRLLTGQDFQQSTSGRGPAAICRVGFARPSAIAVCRTYASGSALVRAGTKARRIHLSVR